MPKLTDAHLIILATAAKRDDGSILPLPKKLKLDSDAAAAVFKNLLKRKLIEEQTAASDAVAWRSSEDGQRFMLAITRAGLHTIGVEPAVEAPATSKPGKTGRRGPKGKKPAPSTSRRARHSRGRDQDARTAIRPGSKQARVIELLRRGGGATIEEMMKATGWQAHSVRGAISGALKKKLGLPVVSEKTEDGKRRYRIAK